MAQWLNSLSPGQLALVGAGATLAAAVIAAAVSVSVALVNGWFAARLAKETAHREYRRQTVEAPLSYSRSVGRAIGEMTAFASRVATWEEVRKETARWTWEVDKMGKQAGALYLADEECEEALRALTTVGSTFAMYLAHAFATPQYGNFSITREHLRLMHLACGGVELAAEAYVYRTRQARRDSPTRVALVLRMSEELRRRHPFPTDAQVREPTQS